MPIIKPPMKKIDGKEVKPPLFLPSLSLTPRSAEETSVAASQLIDNAIRAVQSVLDDPEAKGADKIAAATFIRDTAHGKPTQQVSIRSNAGNTIKEALKFIHDNNMVIEGDVTEIED